MQEEFIQLSTYENICKAYFVYVKIIKHKILQIMVLITFTPTSAGAVITTEKEAFPTLLLSRTSPSIHVSVKKKKSMTQIFKVGQLEQIQITHIYIILYCKPAYHCT